MRTSPGASAKLAACSTFLVVPPPFPVKSDLGWPLSAPLCHCKVHTYLAALAVEFCSEVNGFSYPATRRLQRLNVFSGSCLLALFLKLGCRAHASRPDILSEALLPHKHNHNYIHTFHDFYFLSKLLIFIVCFYYFLSDTAEREKNILNNS